METNHDIVIIGASFGGLATAHRLLGNVFPTMKHTKVGYKITIISPNTQFYWNCGAPRTLVNPERLPAEKVFLDIAPGFAQYGEQYEHRQAYATSIDPQCQVVSYSKIAHGPIDGTVRYDSLLLASGSYYNNPLWSLQYGEDVTKQALSKTHAQLRVAKTIVIAGGGPTGIETAGELGHLYGSTKSISLLCNSPRLLSRLSDSRLGADAAIMLRKLGVTVECGTKVNKVVQEGSQTSLMMSDGTQRNVDFYLDATGGRPNNSWIPKDWLIAEGKVRCHEATLRANIPGFSNVYVIGSIGSYSNGSVPSVLFAYKPLCESIRIDLAGESMTSPAYSNDPLLISV
jgi:apoptosis-inducing factor 2